MAQGFGESSTQYSILYNFDSEIAASTTVSLIDSNGTTILSYSPIKESQSVVFSSPQITSGTYTLKVGSQSYTVEVSSLVITYGSSGGGMPNNGTGGPNRK